MDGDVKFRTFLVAVIASLAVLTIAACSSKPANNQYHVLDPPCGASRSPWKSQLSGADVVDVTSTWNTDAKTKLTVPKSVAAAKDPFCEVQIQLSHGIESAQGPDNVNVWIWLPQTWNGRLQAIGGGGTHA